MCWYPRIVLTSSSEFIVRNDGREMVKEIFHSPYCSLRSKTTLHFCAGRMTGEYFQLWIMSVSDRIFGIYQVMEHGPVFGPWQS